MTTTGGGPALHGAGAATPAGDGGPGVSVRRAPRLRTVLGLARVEASLLARSLLLLGAAAVVVQLRGAIGAPSMTVLAGLSIAGQPGPQNPVCTT